VIAAAIAGTQGSAMAFLIGQNLHLPFAPRLMVDPIASFGYFNDVDSYAPGDPGFATQRAGSNSSSADNFISGSGFDYYVRAKLKYLLPIGDGADEIFETYEVDRGLLVSGAEGGTSWNPLESGRTFIGLRPFYRSQEINGDAGDRQLKTNGLDLNLFWDNRDFSPNPSVGGSVNLTLSRDFGLFDTTNSWTVLQAEIDRYISLGATRRFRQRVLALDAWTAVSPTWEKEGGQVENGPPPYTGATLGGLWRMRGFPSQRFSDKAAIYYAAELRLVPEWNPFDALPGLQRYIGVQWLQIAPFVEVGRVAPGYDLKRLHTSMKWDAGIGLRAFAKGFVVRLDTAYSTEGAGVQMMISQPFQF
jgi:outer membrane translocation and assembly module TamA